jgi:hypothetical protein
MREFGMRKVAARRYADWESACDCCVTFEQIEAWFRERGVAVRLGSVTGGRLAFESVELITAPTARDQP